MPRLTMTLRQAALAGALAVGGVLALTAGTRTPPPSAIDRLAIAERDRRAARIVYPMGQAPRLTLPGGGTQPVRSVLNVGHVLRFGDYVWNDAGIAPAGAAAPLLIRVDLRRQLISVFRGGDEIGTALVLFGAEGRETPHGMLTIVEKDENHYSRSYDAPMPYMLRLTADGIAIHASDVRAAAATHGCIGVPTGFARRLFQVARVGDAVAILGPDEQG